MSRMFPPIGDADNALWPVIKENDLQKTPDAYCVGSFFTSRERSPSSICRRCLAAMLNG